METLLSDLKIQTPKTITNFSNFISNRFNSSNTEKLHDLLLFIKKKKKSPL